MNCRIGTNITLEMWLLRRNTHLCMMKENKSWNCISQWGESFSGFYYKHSNFLSRSLKLVKYCTELHFVTLLIWELLLNYLLLQHYFLGRQWGHWRWHSFRIEVSLCWFASRFYFNCFLQSRLLKGLNNRHCVGEGQRWKTTYQKHEEPHK